MSIAGNSKKIVIAGAVLAAAGVGMHAIRQKKKIEYGGNGKTVLITGASGGIGKEFARIFAEHGYNLVIVARSLDKLEELKEELEDNCDVRVEVISADLSVADGAQLVYDKVQEMGITIDQLVNNAGAGKQAKVIEADPDTLKELINLNVMSVTLLSRLIGADMAQRGEGRILNVASLGAFIPDPYFNVYGPTKAFELFLTEAMFGEMKDTGVSVSVLCPGPVKTNWAANAGKSDSKMAKSPETIAKAGFRGMQAGKVVIVPTILYKAERLLMKNLPIPLQIKIIQKWQNSLIRKERRK